MPHQVFCNDDHISLLAEYAARYDLGGMVGLDEGDRAAQAIGEALHRANSASVNFGCPFTDEREYSHNRAVVADKALNAPMQIPIGTRVVRSASWTCHPAASRLRRGARRGEIAHIDPEAWP